MTVSPAVIEEDLAYKEKMYLDRRRRRIKFWGCERRYAKVLGVPWEKYLLLRDGRSVDGPPIELGEIKPHEVLIVRRLRAGLTVKALAKILGWKVQYIDRMESGRRLPTALRRFWGI